MTDELQVKQESLKTPIEIALGIGEDGRTTARKLYSFLELAQSQFSRWAKTNITENPFAEEGKDFVRFDIDVETPTGGKVKREDYYLSANFAKKLSMQGKTERAEQARDYFIKVEDALKEVARPHKVKALTITSRDVCKMLGKRLQSHGVILREIRECIAELEEMGFNRLDFFMDSTYLSGGGGKEKQPQFLCTERGCEYLSGRLEPADRRIFIAEFKDRFRRLQDVLNGKPVRDVAIPGVRQEGETVFRLYKNNQWGILTLDDEVYNLTPDETKFIIDMVPKLNKNGVRQIKTVIQTYLDNSRENGKLELIGEYRCFNGQITEAPALPDITTGGKSRRLKTDETRNLNEVVNLTIEDAKTRYRMGRNNLLKIANEAGAIVDTLGKRILLDREKLDEYFHSISS